jgi:chromosome segregation ATPase
MGKSTKKEKVNLEIEINRLNIEKAKLETEFETVKTELQQYGEMQYVDDKLSTLEQFIIKIEKELSTIGLVNLKAIDEFDKFRTEFDEYKVKYEKSWRRRRPT